MHKTGPMCQSTCIVNHRDDQQQQRHRPCLRQRHRYRHHHPRRYDSQRDSNVAENSLHSTIMALRWLMTMTLMLVLSPEANDDAVTHYTEQRMD